VEDQVKEMNENNLAMEEVPSSEDKPSPSQPMDGYVQVHVPLYLQIKNQSYFPVFPTFLPTLVLDDVSFRIWRP
jgi:hypothetical protein